MSCHRNAMPDAMLYDSCMPDAMLYECHAKFHVNPSIIDRHISSEYLEAYRRTEMCLYFGILCLVPDLKTVFSLSAINLWLC